MRRPLLLALALVLGCGAARPVDETPPVTEPAMSFSPEVRERIDAVIARYGQGGPEYDASHPPVAVFDWDNTTMRGDVGDLAFATMLDTGAVRRPADFHAWGPLTPAAIAYLEASCPGDVGNGLPTRDAGPCRDALAQIAIGEALPDGSPAFDPERNTQFRAGYSMLARLFAGHNPLVARAIAEATLSRGLEAPVGTRLTIGTQTIDGFLRLQEPMRDLAVELRRAGFTVFVVSASFEPIVRVAAAHGGFAPEHVIGTRLELDAQGEYLPTHPFENEVGTLIPFDVGKRFWIQHEIFGVPVESAREAPISRPILAAGDSDTDRTMLMDAEALAILFDRSAPLVTCLARAEPERFVVLPQFVDPPAPRAVECP